MTKEALKLALEALEYRGVGSWRKRQPAITAIKEALMSVLDGAHPTSGDYALGYAEGFNDACKKPEQEPVAWYRDEDGIRIYYETKVWDDATPLYTTPPQRTLVGLTEDEVALICADCSLVTPSDFYFYQAIEAKLKEKNA